MRLIIAETLNQTPTGQQRVELADRKPSALPIPRAVFGVRLRAGMVRFAVVSGSSMSKQITFLHLRRTKGQQAEAV